MISGLQMNILCLTRILTTKKSITIYSQSYTTRRALAVFNMEALLLKRLLFTVIPYCNADMLTILQQKRLTAASAGTVKQALQRVARKSRNLFSHQ